MTATEVKGCGRQRGYTEEYAPDAPIRLLSKIKLEIVTEEEEKVEEMISTIQSLAKTNKIGAGKILVIPVEDVLRTRTKERGRIAGERTKTFVFPKENCQACPRRNKCTDAKNTGRTIGVGSNEEYLQKARQRQKTKEFKEIYNKRRPPVERKEAPAYPSWSSQNKIQRSKKISSSGPIHWNCGKS